MNLDVKKLFEEPSLIQITTWARGVIENKDARDVVFALANAGSKEGKYVQAWENYVDLPIELASLFAHTPGLVMSRLLSKYVYENEHPDVVVLTNEGSSKGKRRIARYEAGWCVNSQHKKRPGIHFEVFKGHDLSWNDRVHRCD